VLIRVGQPPVEELQERGWPQTLVVQMLEHVGGAHRLVDCDDDDFLEREVSELELEVRGRDIRVHVGHEPADRDDPGEHRLVGDVHDRHGHLRDEQFCDLLEERLCSLRIELQDRVVVATALTHGCLERHPDRRHLTCGRSNR